MFEELGFSCEIAHHAAAAGPSFWRSVSRPHSSTVLGYATATSFAHGRRLAEGLRPGARAIGDRFFRRASPTTRAAPDRLSALRAVLQSAAGSASTPNS